MNLCAEVARCTLLVSCSIDLAYCVIFVCWVGVCLEQAHRTLKASEWSVPDFPVISLYFVCLLALVASSQLLQHSLKI